MGDLTVFKLNCNVLCCQQTGPGLVYKYYTSLFGKGIFIHTVPPEEPLLQRVEHRIYSSRYTPAIITNFFLYAESIQVLLLLFYYYSAAIETGPLDQ